VLRIGCIALVPVLWNLVIRKGRCEITVMSFADVQGLGKALCKGDLYDVGM